MLINYIKKYLHIIALFLNYFLYLIFSLFFHSKRRTNNSLYLALNHNKIYFDNSFDLILVLI